MRTKLLKLLTSFLLMFAYSAMGSDTYEAPSWKYKGDKPGTQKMKKATVADDAGYAIDEEFENGRDVASDEDAEPDYSTREPSSTVKKKHHKKTPKEGLPRHWKFDRRG